MAKAKTVRKFEAITTENKLFIKRQQYSKNTDEILEITAKWDEMDWVSSFDVQEFIWIIEKVSKVQIVFRIEKFILY